MRPTMHIVIFFVALNGFSGMLIQSGVAADLGVAPQPGGGEQVDVLQENADEFGPSGGGSGGTLFDLYTSAGSAVQSVLAFGVGGFILLENIGIPVWLTATPQVIASILLFRDLFHALTGRSV